MKIKKFSDKYLDQVLEIEKKSFQKAWNKQMFLSSAFDKATKFNIAVLETETSETETNETETAGYCIYKIIDKEAEILRIAVGANFRRRGYGGEMIGEIIECCRGRGVDKIFLEVNSTNISALNLYRAFGFDAISIRKKYYSDGDALILEKKL
jgi:ribosomal-protein-alanine N-acetyltransferase